MQKLITAIAVLSLSLGAIAQETATKPKKEAAAKAELNEKCPICDKAVNPKCTAQYEGKTYAFATGDCCNKWTAERKASLYDRIGGKAAMNGRTGFAGEVIHRSRRGDSYRALGAPHHAYNGRFDLPRARPSRTRP